MGLAYLAMEKYESARDAFQASLKGELTPWDQNVKLPHN
jgi:hypothetical protein